MCGSYSSQAVFGLRARAPRVATAQRAVAAAAQQRGQLAVAGVANRASGAGK